MLEHKFASPVEVQLKFSTFVGSLPDAFVFVMAKLDDVGVDPEVSITPVWGGQFVVDGDVDDDVVVPVRMFEVIVSGSMVEGEGEGAEPV